MLHELKINSGTSVPKDSIINIGFGDYGYFDFYEIKVKGHYEVEHISKELFESPKWVELLLSLRDSIVKPFGLKTSKDAKDSLKSEDDFFFRFIERNENEIVGGEDDAHLNFRASVMSKPIEDQSIIRISTLVKFNNFFGRLYFFPVKPFHKIIIKSMLKRLYCKLNNVKSEQ